MIDLSNTSIIQLPIDALKLDPNNAKIHSKKQISQIVASIRTNGFFNAIMIDDDNLVVGGHGRLLGAKAAGLKTVPTICLGKLSDMQRLMVQLADNKIAENSSWDLDLLQDQLDQIAKEEVNFEFKSIGFDTATADIVLNGKGKQAEDHIPARPKYPTTLRGDIWVLPGLGRLGCGDARDAKFVRGVLGEDRIDAVFSDPPYNLKIDGVAAGRGKHPEFAHASGEMKEPEYGTFLHDSMAPLVAFSKDGAIHFICIDHRQAHVLLKVCDGLYSERLNICVWNKTNAGMGSLYRSKHEFVVVTKVGTAPHTNNVQLGRHGRNRTNVWDYDGANSAAGRSREDSRLHPTTKPIQLVADAIQDVTAIGELVFDNFSGSGTTLLACLRARRRFAGIEIDEGYVDVAIMRWQALTGLDAIHEASGQTFNALQFETQRVSPHG